MGCDERKVRVHRLGVDLRKIPFVPRTFRKGDVLKVLIAGTFREKKGIPYALEAVGILRREYSAVKVTVVGETTGKESEVYEKKKIMDVIARYGLTTNVRLLGFQPYSVLLKELYDHHIFLSPSVTAADGDTEGGAPVTIIEAAASGMPVVSTRHCDIPDVLGAYGAEMFAEERDVQGLVSILSRLIHGVQTWRELLVQCRSRVEVNHDPELQGTRLGEIYKGLKGR